MTNSKQFAKNFAPHAAPPELLKLLAFQEEVSGFEEYSDGFGLLSDDKGGLKSWSEQSEFLSRLHPFAQANGSGSFYALWNDGKSNEPASFPVVVFGDEGGVHVVADNVRELLRILAFDAEPMIDFEEVTYYKDEDEHDPSDGHDDYEAWLRDEIGLSPADDPASVVQAAQAKHRGTFESWFGQYAASE